MYFCFALNYLWLDFCVSFVITQVQRIRTFKLFLRKNKRNSLSSCWHPSFAESLFFIFWALECHYWWVTGEVLEWMVRRAEQECGSYGTVTCAQLVPQGGGQLFLVSGVMTSYAQAVIKSPVSGGRPPPNMWTSDYFRRRHNLCLTLLTCSALPAFAPLYYADTQT